MQLRSCPYTSTQTQHTALSLSRLLKLVDYKARESSLLCGPRRNIWIKSLAEAT